MKARLLMCVVAVSALAGCATPPERIVMPEGYTGPKAYLNDSAKPEDGSKAQVFAVSTIDGQRVLNTLDETRRASYGKGFALTVSTVGRPIAAQPMKVGLIGTHTTAAPIHEIASRAAGTFFSFEGIVDFAPRADRSYVVKGELKAQGSSVWIEDSLTGEVVTRKVDGKP